MAEYLSPGVYVEETSYRSKSIEGVATSTTGFAGRTRSGPVYFPNGPLESAPRLITSFTEYESVYGGLQSFADGSINYMAHAARLFFENAGSRLYISRVYTPSDENMGIASAAVGTSDATGDVAWRARWPGAYGNVSLTVSLTQSGNIHNRATKALSAADGSVVGIVAAPQPSEAQPGQPAVARTARALPAQPHTFAIAQRDPKGVTTLRDAQGAEVAVPENDSVHVVSLNVSVTGDDKRTQTFGALSPNPAHTRYIGRILGADNPENANALVYLDVAKLESPAAVTFELLELLAPKDGPTRSFKLENGNDGEAPSDIDIEGREADLDDVTVKATGLEALGEIEDIAIIAAPDGGGNADVDQVFLVAQALIRQAEKARYRIAIIDGPKNASLNEIREYRARLDSTYAALYHPWLEVENPLERPIQGAPPSRLMLPPSGAIAGIYGRSDVERGVHKAPANEVVQGVVRFEQNINKGRQDVLNPEGINALRFFEGRSYRVWGARTISSDPEWKYVNVRRLFVFLEHSIDKGTQYAVFEPNNERLWANIKQSVEDFLFVQWKNGALLGSKPEEAYFVRCDRTTMSQNDLDNGRLICLVGVAPVMPAEFVIFRIGQFTASTTS